MIIYQALFIDIYTSLFVNALMIIFFIVLSSFIRINQKKHTTAIGVIRGFSIGFGVLVVMIAPFHFSEGIQFDARTVILSLTGALYGPIPATIAGIIAIIYRLYIGGEGVYVGTSTIAIATLIGIYWPYRKNIKFKSFFLDLFFMSLIVHIITVIIFLVGFNLGNTIWYLIPIFIIIFPFSSTFAAILVNYQMEYLKTIEEATVQKTLLRYSIDSIPYMEIYSLDKEYNYLVFNSFHFQQMKKFYGVEIKKGDNFLDFIIHNKMRNRFKNNFDSALNGKATIINKEVEVLKGKHLEEHFTSILNDNDEIIGVSVFSYEITERIKKEEEILTLSYKESLTNLYNRRYFDTQTKKFHDEKISKLSLVSIDINGLKLINDVFGHKYGDELLIKVANKLLKAFNDSGIVSRVGGDEFYVVLPNWNEKKAHLAMEKIKYEIEIERIKGVYFSISYGISSKTKKNTFEEMVQDAENAMYRNKLNEVKQYRSKSISSILDVLDNKCEVMNYHSERVLKLVELFSEELKLSFRESNKLKEIAKIYDIGNIAIDSNLLCKKEKLSNIEYDEIKKHTEIGFRILSATEEYSDIAFDVLSHHERYDGKGYPRELKGEEIPYLARILTICDSYNAMTTPRHYRKTLSKEEALKEIEINSGSQFDPLLVEKFVELLKRTNDL